MVVQWIKLALKGAGEGCRAQVGALSGLVRAKEDLIRVQMGQVGAEN